ncbi:MAG: sugar phosphate isomerase/epimerase [Bacteroidales bacterium]|nr:sugar phosphate isomerase/epimerase [Bacteroidales bacterium]MCF8457765.1 sugar phosphate isomerase/epimerase [Bacteroidales bacterium]
MSTRRSFIKTISAATVAGMVFPYRALAIPANKEVGLQLYSIRELVKKDLAGTLKILKEIGYSTIEAAGYGNNNFYDLNPGDFKTIVFDEGLNPLSSHCGITIENAQKTIDDHLEGGFSYIVLPSIPGEKRKSIDDYKTLADEFNQIGELCKKNGFGFGYHNHAFEFEKKDGQIPYDVLLNETEADKVFFQLDTYWIVYGGYQPVEYFNKFPGRFKHLHIKDMDKGAEKHSTEIGSGIINFKEIVGATNISGMEHIIVEQEHFTIDPIESITQSYNYINSLKF